MSGATEALPPLERAIDDYLDGYTLEVDDGYYQPNDTERLIAKDVVMGLLAEPWFVAALAQRQQVLHKNWTQWAESKGLLPETVTYEAMRLAFEAGALTAAPSAQAEPQMPLPEPTFINNAQGRYWGFTADQMRDYARAALAQRQQAPTTAWLVEWRFNGVQWLYLWPSAPGGFSFTADPNSALRFARRQDAEACLAWAREVDRRRGAGVAGGELLVTDHEWNASASPQAPAQPVGIDPMQNPMRPAYFMNYAKDETKAEMVLRKLACWLGVGGYNAPTVDADLFHRKIVDGIEQLLASARSMPSAAQQGAPTCSRGTPGCTTPHAGVEDWNHNHPYQHSPMPNECASASPQAPAQCEPLTDEHISALWMSGWGAYCSRASFVAIFREAERVMSKRKQR